ncbi:CRISPR-associated protein Cas4 [Natronorubrum sulfidifaciens]|uniref:CRISPR-associated exonuclease Cas4 n=1 Tax=Natronorubrum sulfidifaciens JCM 14089 TaxID=1230460 RepID=L9VZ08_9EURY|nr:CRISPR-associated protein Cas4 [Natronorubrum sulfidifaciens]ELY41478.1 CRISPR-associated protein Cas4 [Natronorubrum sulfidifaciens JCM 14089]
MTDTDPVIRLLETARGNPIDEPFRVTGVMMQYYHVCKRELWFESRNLEIDRENPTVVRGTRVDDTAYGEKRRNLHLGMIALDLLEDGRIVEVKPSSALTEPARMQLLYYLWYLEHVAEIQKDGVLAHPRERKRESVELTDERTEKVENAIRGIHDVVAQETPPSAKEKSFCDSCAYYDFCWC